MTQTQTMEPWLRDKPEAAIRARYEALQGSTVPRSIVDRAARLGNIGQALSNLIGAQWDNYRLQQECVPALTAERTRVWDERDRLIMRGYGRAEGVVDPYSVLLLRAAELGWPEKYVEDFREHDYRLLRENNNPDVFYWAVRDWGTNTAMPKDFSWITATWSVYGDTAKYFKYECGRLSPLKTRPVTYPSRDSTGYGKKTEILP